MTGSMTGPARAGLAAAAVTALAASFLAGMAVAGGPTAVPRPDAVRVAPLGLRPRRVPDVGGTAIVPGAASGA